jgi:hypothetical protein
MDEITEFAQRYNLDAAALAAKVETGHWGTVHRYLCEHGADPRTIGRTDADAINAIVADYCLDRMQARMAAQTAAQPEPAPQPESKAETAPAPAPVGRVRAIIEAPEAVGREQTARHLAFNTSLSAADARALLRASPDPNAAAPGPVMSELERWAATVAAMNGKRPFPEGYVPPAPKAPVGPHEPQQALVKVYPPAARPAPIKPAAKWSNVIARMNGSAT